MHLVAAEPLELVGVDSVAKGLLSDERPVDARTFTVATDAATISLIESAKRRRVVIAPALSRAIADALAAGGQRRVCESGVSVRLFSIT